MNDGAKDRIEFAHAICALGGILVARSARGICALSLGDQPKALEAALRGDFRGAELVAAPAAMRAQVAQIVAFVDRPTPNLSLPLHVRGTAFQQRVWKALCEIPVGTTRTYAQVAQTIGAPKALRAVGVACGANKVAILIPCHRVVGTDGDLRGYRWAAARKQALLQREAQAARASLDR